MAKVSILMNCYNCEKYLREAIDSVYAQTYQNWEIIFIDNCSIDKSERIARSYDEKIKYYKTPYNMSLCGARVFAKDFIDGDYFCVLDTDDLWMPKKLEKQIHIMTNNEEIGIIYTNSIYFSEQHEVLLYKNKMPSGNLFKQLLGNYFFSFETVMIRKAVMNKYKIYFDNKYNVSSDAEFFTKLSYHTDAYYIDEALAKWRFGHGSESDRSLCLFPAEAELLLKDLAQVIPNFEFEYAENIKIAKAKIMNMYGMCYWGKQDSRKARIYFKQALKSNIKYCIPLLLSYFITYYNFNLLKKLYKKY